MSKIAIDTNGLIYLHDINAASDKRRIANKLILDKPFISSQVVSEYLNVCNRKLMMSKQDCMDSLMGWLPYCFFITFELAIFRNAIRLIEKYQLQMFDAIIVSSAFRSRLFDSLFRRYAT